MIKKYAWTVPVWQIAKIVYKAFVRRMLKKAINDPKKTWDDTAMAAADEVFGYKEK
jgi:hypothetical protein